MRTYRISCSLSVTLEDGHFIRYIVTHQGATLQRPCRSLQFLSQSALNCCWKCDGNLYGQIATDLMRVFVVIILLTILKNISWWVACSLVNWQTMYVYADSIYLLLWPVEAIGSTWSIHHWRGHVDQDVPQEAKTAPVFSVQRHPRIWQHCHPVEKGKFWR